MFDDFHESSDIMPVEASVAVYERALNQSEAFVVLPTWAGDEAFLGDFEGARINVQAGDFRDGGFLEEATEEFPFAATEVESGIWSEGSDEFGDAIKANGVKRDLFFDFGLFLGFVFFCCGRGDSLGLPLALVVLESEDISDSESDLGL